MITQDGVEASESSEDHAAMIAALEEYELEAACLQVKLFSGCYFCCLAFHCGEGPCRKEHRAVM